MQTGLKLQAKLVELRLPTYLSYVYSHLHGWQLMRRCPSPKSS